LRNSSIKSGDIQLHSVILLSTYQHFQVAMGKTKYKNPK